MSERPIMPNESTGAFSRALASESIPDELKPYLSPRLGEFDENLHELLVQYAQTVAYKVYHNLRCGHEMDMRFDPLTYVDCGSNVAISHDLFVRIIRYIRKPPDFTEAQYESLKKMFLEANFS